jgi:hypothetical protein
LQVTTPCNGASVELRHFDNNQEKDQVPLLQRPLAVEWYDSVCLYQFIKTYPLLELLLPFST